MQSVTIRADGGGLCSLEVRHQLANGEVVSLGKRGNDDDANLNWVFSDFEADEYLTGFQVTWTDFIKNITLFTDRQTYGPHPDEQGNKSRAPFLGSEGYELVGFCGTAADRIYSLGPVYRSRGKRLPAIGRNFTVVLPPFRIGE